MLLLLALLYSLFISEAVDDYYFSSPSCSLSPQPPFSPFHGRFVCPQMTLIWPRKNKTKNRVPEQSQPPGKASASAALQVASRKVFPRELSWAALVGREGVAGRLGSFFIWDQRSFGGGGDRPPWSGGETARVQFWIPQESSPLVKNSNENGNRTPGE